MRVGVYIRRVLSRIHGGPEELAQRLADLGVSEVIFGAIWQDDAFTARRQIMNSIEVLEEYGLACLAAGMSPGLWGYPAPFIKKTNFISTIGSLLEMQGGDLWDLVLTDPEKPYKGHHKELVTHSQSLRRICQAACTPLGLTTYGVPRWHDGPRGLEYQHMTDPCLYDFVSPQFYVAENSMVTLGLQDWRALADDRREPLQVDSSVPAYGPNSGAALPGYVRHMRDTCQDLGLAMGTVYIWSDVQLLGKEPGTRKHLHRVIDIDSTQPK